MNHLKQTTPILDLLLNNFHCTLYSQAYFYNIKAKSCQHQCTKKKIFGKENFTWYQDNLHLKLQYVTKFESVCAVQSSPFSCFQKEKYTHYIAKTLTCAHVAKQPQGYVAKWLHAYMAMQTKSCSHVTIVSRSALEWQGILQLIAELGSPKWLLSGAP